MTARTPQSTNATRRHKVQGGRVRKTTRGAGGKRSCPFRPVVKKGDMQYEILTAYSSTGLDAAMKQYVEQGWKAQGGVGIAADLDTRGDSICQYAVLMVKEERGQYE